ncbi:MULTISPECIES: hypothetical protein [unclassified Bradyrhizobium]|uniref:hypothetical protein n=1 Tax=unclassified Bradyrhizobium TaxID=2631580 RepID=UPI002915F61C|nr:MULTISPECIES: hypothetical protein [unclassified Bradyrhizobium]
MRALQTTLRLAFSDETLRLRPIILVIGTVIGTLASLTTEASGAFLTDVFDLRCSVNSPQRGSDYALHIEAPKYLGSPRIQWVGKNAHDLQVVVFNETTIIADVNTRLSNFPDNAEAMSFRINRITGAFEVDFLRSPTTLDGKPPFGGARLVMTEFSEIGKCSKVEREF